MDRECSTRKIPLFTDAKRRKNKVKKFIRGGLTGDCSNRIQCGTQVQGKQFQVTLLKTG
jgi:hypothetical protein